MKKVHQEFLTKPKLKSLILLKVIRKTYQNKLTSCRLLKKTFTRYAVHKLNELYLRKKDVITIVITGDAMHDESSSGHCTCTIVVLHGFTDYNKTFGIVNLLKSHDHSSLPCTSYTETA